MSSTQLERVFWILLPLRRDSEPAVRDGLKNTASGFGIAAGPVGGAEPDALLDPFCLGINVTDPREHPVTTYTPRRTVHDTMSPIAGSAGTAFTT
ncbi:hypothetical protein [Rhodococcus sp. USK13]|uniref:hypothetical protein n=1 Tax=Rhodococcus sp. USK13 TaxID=2806442 RepID=UPI001BCDD5A1|nr:hypothetical protein [Rhodococcus sp. USK13]